MSYEDAGQGREGINFLYALRGEWALDPLRKECEFSSKTCLSRGLWVRASLADSQGPLTVGGTVVGDEVGKVEGRSVGTLKSLGNVLSCAK